MTRNGRSSSAARSQYASTPCPFVVDWPGPYALATRRITPGTRPAYRHSSCSCAHFAAPYRPTARTGEVSAYGGGVDWSYTVPPELVSTTVGGWSSRASRASKVAKSLWSAAASSGCCSPSIGLMLLAR